MVNYKVCHDTNCRLILLPPSITDKPGKAKKTTSNQRDQQNPFLLWLKNASTIGCAYSRRVQEDEREEKTDQMFHDVHGTMSLAAYDFLSEGAPYKGFVPYIPRSLRKHFQAEICVDGLDKTKYSLQRTYYRHCINMLKEDQLARWDNESKLWVVANEKTLKLVLNLYNDNYNSPVWVPQVPEKLAQDGEFSHMSLILEVLKILHEWDDYNVHLQHKLFKLQQETAEREKLLRIEAIERSNNTYNNPTIQEVEKLDRVYNLTWDAKLDDACARSICIGIPNTMSNCARLLRALDLKITTVERIYSTSPIEVRSEYAEMRLRKQHKRKPSSTSKRSVKKTNTQDCGTTQLPQTSHDDQHLSHPDNLEETRAHEHAAYSRDQRAPHSSCATRQQRACIESTTSRTENSNPFDDLKVTRCTQCYGHVTDQFRDCYCGDRWSLCMECGHYSRDDAHTVQMCPCKDKQFFEKQQTVVEHVDTYEEKVELAREHYETFSKYHPVLTDTLHAIAYKTIGCNACKLLYENGETLLTVKAREANIDPANLYDLQYNDLVGKDEQIDPHIRCVLGFAPVCSCWNVFKPHTQTVATPQ